jgi:hypothetical protein
VCFMIKRNAGYSQWKRSQYGPNVAALQIQTDIGAITVINVYNPRGGGPRLREWTNVKKALHEAEGEVILLGDFNAHHTTWGGVGVTCDQNAEHLLHAVKRQGLYLLTPPGEPTWRRGESNTVIDLTFSSEELERRVEFCGPEERWALTQDHIPIRLTLNVGILPNPQANSTRFALDKANWDSLKKELGETKWQDAPEVLEALQRDLVTLLPKWCPRARPSKWARPEWSPEASTLLAGARQARRRYTAHGRPEDAHESSRLSNQLSNRLRKEARANWRQTVAEITGDPTKPHNEGLWRLSRWSRRKAGVPHADPHIPALRRTPEDEATSNKDAQAEILADKFFPGWGEIVQPDPHAHSMLTRSALISQPGAGKSNSNETRQLDDEPITNEEVNQVLASLPNRKAPGPDGIPNEVLKALANEIGKGITKGINESLAKRMLPAGYRESITITLRKEGKKDYSLPNAYRPIALENTLAKVVEKVIANRMSVAAESQGLLPWNQMGARKERSTLSAIGLLTACVETAWQARPGCVVSMLSLDLAGAFDNVPHQTLMDTLRQKQLPPRVLAGVECFLHARRTRIAFAGYQSGWIYTGKGIPQGSPLSPILFLFYISGLLERFDRPQDNVLGFGFVDDTNLIAWGDSAADNSRRLTAAHAQCKQWADNSGATFAPEKYQLIHFTKRRRHAREDLASTVRIGEVEISPQEKSIRVLGVWLDPALSWKEHVLQASRRGIAASDAIARLATSTWGPSSRNTRLLYTAVVRPTLLYGAQEWSTRIAGAPLPAVTLAPLHRIQNKCLRTITGGYKRAPRAALEQETRIQPLDLYISVTRLTAAIKTQAHPVEAEIAGAADAVWNSMRTARGGTAMMPRRPTAREVSRIEAGRIIGPVNARAPLPKESTKEQVRSVQHHHNELWKQRWLATAAKSYNTAVTWRTPWELEPRTLYAGLSKAESTALFLMRTEVIGLNAWLTAVQVPDKTPRCVCGWVAQTVRHVLTHCPLYERADLFIACGTESLYDILGRPGCAQHAARWFVRNRVLEQFRLAAEIKEEEREGYRSLLGAERW